MLNVKEAEGFKYIDEGKGEETLLLLHGLFGALLTSTVTVYTSFYHILFRPDFILR